MNNSLNNISNINNQEIILLNGKYIGQSLNGKPEGKGTSLFNNGERYEGYWINGKFEGKGIYYYNSGER